MIIDNWNNDDPAFFANIMEMIRSGSCTIIYKSDTAIAVRLNKWDLYCIASKNVDEVKPIISGLDPSKCDIVAHGDAIAEFARQHGFCNENPCWQVFYDKPEPPDCPPSFVIRKPGPEDFIKVVSTYELGNEESIREDFISEDFIGGYLDGEMIGYVGIHSEGSMGMLHIFEQYRHKGYAQQLYSYLIGRQLSKGRIPYAHIIKSNLPSINLHKKLGFTFSKQLVYWMWGNQ